MPNMDILPTEDVTLAAMAFETGVDRRQLIRLIQRNEVGGVKKLPGATGAYLIPRSEVDRIKREYEAAPALAEGQVSA